MLSRQQLAANSVENPVVRQPMAAFLSGIVVSQKFQILVEMYIYRKAKYLITKASCKCVLKSVHKTPAQRLAD